MKIRMIRTRRGSQDCFKVELFEEGREYTLYNIGLAGQFIHDGSAVAV